MSNSRGIFDSFPGQPAVPSPFAVVPEPRPASPFSAVPETPPASPFSVAPENPPASPFTAARTESPFAVADDAASRPLEPGKPARLPERRKAESPFQMVDAKEGFGLEAVAPVQSFAASPFEVAAATSPFASAPTQLAAAATSPFAFEAAPVQFAAAPAQAWQQATPAPAKPASQSFAAAEQNTSPFSHTPSGESDSASIRQLELRAIFGVDREMNADEILQRARALPGVRHIARVPLQDVGTIENFKHTIANLGFGGGGLRVFAGSVPIEFIREGQVMLAVQTDGGFAPGVRETLMIVGRELGRSA